MILNVGKKVVYPNQGPCRVGPVVKKDFGGRPIDFYPLAVMDDSGNMLFVPVDKIKALGIRQLMEKSEIPRLLRRLSRGVEPIIEPTTGHEMEATRHGQLEAVGLRVGTGSR